MAPDGTYLSVTDVTVTSSGTYVAGSDGRYVRAPDVTVTQGSYTQTMSSGGSYVGSMCGGSY